jgi:hypothetical protein
MVDGADKMLDLVAGAANDVILQLSERRLTELTGWT